MRIIDSHVHLYDEPGYLEQLLKTLDDLGVEKCCLSGLGSLFGFCGNDEVEKAMHSHPDRIIGAYFIRPGFQKAKKLIEHTRMDFVCSR